MRICLFEDHGFLDLEPLALTRPIFDLYCGLTTLSAKQSRFFAPCTVGALVRPFLADLVRQNRPDMPVNDAAWLGAGPTIMVNARWLPPEDSRGALLAASGSCIGVVEGEVAFAVLTPDRLKGLTPATLSDFLAAWKQTLPQHEVGGRMIARPWDLVNANGEQIVGEFRSRNSSRLECRPLNVSMVGPAGSLCIDRTARLDPLVVVDTTNGPVVIDRGAVIGAFTRLEGPCYVGPGTHVLGGKVRGGATLGPYCRIGGEVEASIVQGFANKYHDGYLGHSYVGEWVNIGAGVQVSDLRHDYGEVTVPANGLKIPTGSSKVGSFIGDHTKIGIGSLLNTGSNIGAFANVLPAGCLLPRSVPSFCKVSHGALAENDSCEALFATAEEVMRRRGVQLTEEHREVYRRAYDQTALQRRQALHDDDRLRLRKSA